MTLLRKWVGGFGRNQSGRPYILSNDTASQIFPRAHPSAVAPDEIAQPIWRHLNPPEPAPPQPTSTETITGVLQNVDLNLAPMEEEVSGGVHDTFHIVNVI